MVKCRNLVLCQSLLAIVVLSGALPVGAAERIRIRGNLKGGDTVTIDETASPPTITVSSEVRVFGAEGSLLDLGGGKFQILVAGNAYYHVKVKGGTDSLTVLDGPGSSKYFLGAGADSDTVLVHDGPGNDEYRIEGKGGDDIHEIHDDSGDGDDHYFIKGASGADLFNVSDGPGNDFYDLKGREEAVLIFTDVGGDVDVVRTRGISPP
jgi:hypothetical protein